MAGQSKEIMVVAGSDGDEGILVREVDGERSLEATKLRSEFIEKAKRRLKSRKVAIRKLEEEKAKLTMEMEEARGRVKTMLEDEQVRLDERLKQVREERKAKMKPEVERLEKSLEERRESLKRDLTARRDELKGQLGKPYKIEGNEKARFYNVLREYCGQYPSAEGQMVKEVVPKIEEVVTAVTRRFAGEREVDSERVRKFLWVEFFYPAISEKYEREKGEVCDSIYSRVFQEKFRKELQEICRFYLHSFNFDWSRRADLISEDYSPASPIELGLMTNLRKEIFHMECNKCSYEAEDKVYFIGRIEASGKILLISDKGLTVLHALKNNNFDEVFLEKIYRPFLRILVRFGVPEENVTKSVFLRSLQRTLATKLKIEADGVKVFEKIDKDYPLNREKAQAEAMEEARLYVAEFVEKHSLATSPYSQYFKDKSNLPIKMSEREMIEDLLAQMLSDVSKVAVQDELFEKRKEYKMVEGRLARMEDDEEVNRLKTELRIATENLFNGEEITVVVGAANKVAERLKNLEKEKVLAEKGGRLTEIGRDIDRLKKLEQFEEREKWVEIDLDQFPNLKEELSIFIVRKVFEWQIKEALALMKQPGEIATLEQRIEKRQLAMEYARLNSFIEAHFKVEHNGAAFVRSFFSDIFQTFRDADLKPGFWKSKFGLGKMTKQEIAAGIKVSPEAERYFQLQVLFHKFTQVGCDLVKSQSHHQQEMGELFLEMAEMVRGNVAGLTKDLESKLKVPDIEVFFGASEMGEALTGLLSREGSREVYRLLRTLDDALVEGTEVAEELAVGTVTQQEDWDRRLAKVIAVTPEIER